MGGLIINNIKPVDTLNNTSPRWYVGDNGSFLGTALYTNGSLTGFDIINGVAPSSLNSVGSTEFGYSFTGTCDGGNKLRDFIINNDSSNFFRENKVLSISIVNDDPDKDLAFTIRNMTKTILKAGQFRSISWGKGYPINELFFNDFVFNSSALITVSWNQVEI